MTTVERPTTPTGVPSEFSGPVITAAQKQALIDNLSLEVNDRARKLRAQYSIMASSLKSRLEMRINRIPREHRSMTMGDLIEKYSEDLNPPKKQLVPPTLVVRPLAAFKPNHQSPAKPSPSRPKRSSAEMLGSDKENQQNNLNNPKKRKVDSPATRRADPSTVLSPKSHNSRTYQASPLKSTTTSSRAAPSSPIKSSMAPPAKPARANAQSRAVTKSSTTSTVGRARKPTAAAAASAASARDRTVSNSSASSGVSTTTVVNKKTTSATATKRGIMAKVSTMASGVGRKAAAAATKKKVEKVEAEAPAAAKRSLRSRK